MVDAIRDGSRLDVEGDRRRLSLVSRIRGARVHMDPPLKIIAVMAILLVGAAWALNSSGGASTARGLGHRPDAAAVHGSMQCRPATPRPRPSLLRLRSRQRPLRQE